MVDVVKRYGFQGAKITVTAVMLCLFCGLLFSNPAASSSNQQFVADTYLTVEASDDTAASFLSYSSASNFEHNKQSAKWQFERIDETAFSIPLADTYLLAEPIIVDWFLIKPSSRFRLSGWKDASLQFKIKNAFI